jgi:hypothetical protein
MKRVSLYEQNDFDELAFKRLLVHDSPYFKILNFNLISRRDRNFPFMPMKLKAR